MPELPEVEHVRRTLQPVVGRTIRSVRLRRPGVVRGRTSPRSLLAGRRIAAVLRHGKQLALVARPGHWTAPADDACLCLHLGMTGSLRWRPAGVTPDRRDPHTHVLWRLDDGSTLAFRDPRRFGGLWPTPSLDALRAGRWAELGEDALAITPARLHRRLRVTRRPIKAALLDQAVVAGLGNIYVDELLFAARLSPHRPAGSLDRQTATGLVRRMRTLLARAIDAGGSSLRDYVDGNGSAGGYQLLHRVYGRAGRPCPRRGCGQLIHTSRIAGRTTAWCPTCQPLPAQTGFRENRGLTIPLPPIRP